MTRRHASTRRQVSRLGVLGLALATAPLALVAPAEAQETAECSTTDQQLIDTSAYAIVGQGFNKAWRLATGEGVTVAVVDSGIDTRNPHLRDAVAGSYSVPGVPGDATVAREGPDPFGHGTAVAGIIASRPVTGSSLVGAAYQADLLSVRVYVQDVPDQPTPGDPTAARIAEGIEWAVRNGADVINVSMSAPAGDPDVDKIVAATDLARERDVLVVAAAGDGPGEEVVNALRYPAAADGVIGVSALNSSRGVDGFTVQGGHVDVAADGSDVLVAYRQSGDCLAGANGTTYTSWSTAFVSGLAALLRERYPEESAEQIRYRILASASRPRSSQRWGDDYGWGTIAPFAALTMTLDPSRAGPVFPGNAAPAPARARTQSPSLTPLGEAVDPLDPARGRLLWWSIGAGGALALLLLARPLVGQRRRR